MRLTATYSIVARDEATGELGVGVQSHYFAVGAVVPWAEAGVGAVATQAFSDPGYGPRALDELRGGGTPTGVLNALLTRDEGRESRQVAVVDTVGRIAVHTGKGCVEAAGHRTGDGYAVQGNMLRSDGAWDAMAAAYEAADAGLAERLLAALEAAERAGGDVRGRQSAALLVVSGKGGNCPWDEKRIDLRVDDARDPLGELRRLLGIEHANASMDRALDALRGADIAAALKELAAARELRPKDPYIQFWGGVVHMYAGQAQAARESFQAAHAADPGWTELLRRLVPAGVLPSPPPLLGQLVRELARGKS